MQTNNISRIKQLSIYPVKSLAGIQLNQTIVTPIGLQGDRTMMLIDEKQRFISQRQYPQMALIKTQLTPTHLIVNALQMPQLNIAFSQFNQSSITVTVWENQCHGHIASNLINQWFSDYLKAPVKLINYDYKKPRKTDPIFSKKGDIVSFADGFPILITTQASLDDLNSRLQQPVKMAAFRPNIVIDGETAYSEDRWKKLMIGEIEFEAVKPCSRCILTTIDPDNAVKSADKEPLKTLAQYRKTPSGIIFGMSLIPRSYGKIQIGDTINLIE